LAAGQLDIFVTADQNIRYQQNLSNLPLSVAVLVASDNRFESLLPAAAQLQAGLPSLAPRSLVVFGR
jgi:hypothetical protein